MNRVIILCLFLAACNSDKPSVLIIGDSISLGYTPYVQEELSGYEVFHASGDEHNNDRGTSYSLEHIQEILANVGPVNIIHANWGLWDMFHAPGEDFPKVCDFNFPARTPIENYRENLKKLSSILEKTGAKIIIATTTPVPEGNECVIPSEVDEYNSALKEVAQEHGFQIDDINSYMKSYQYLHNPIIGIHYSEEGYQLISYQVSDSINLSGN